MKLRARISRLRENTAELMSAWFKFQEIWKAGAYTTFKDYDTYLVLIYLAHKTFQGYGKRFIYFSKDDIYKRNELIIDKINLIDISLDLGIPKETIRRKINELQERNILQRKGKSIILTSWSNKIKNPTIALESFTYFLSKFSVVLSKQVWFGDALSKEKIEKFTNKHFTICWSHFLDMQINSMIRSRKIFGDLETWHIWSIILLNQTHYLYKSLTGDIFSNKKIDQKNYYESIMLQKVSYGVNASSIADVSNIPRATVIRKLKQLIKDKLVKRNQKSEYFLDDKGRINKRIKKENEKLFKEISIFVTTFFNLMKKSNFQA